MKIAVGSRVCLHFELQLASGEVIDSNFDAEPATLTLGDGNMLPGFEHCLIGLESGSKITTTVAAVDGFGVQNPDNIQTFARSQLAAVCGDDTELVAGAVLSFADAANGELPGVVRRVGEDDVDVDFNHPLAGRDIIFKVAIIDVKDVEQNND